MGFAQQGKTWNKQRELSPGQKQFTGWRFNNVQPVVRPGGSEVDGMLLFYGWKDTEDSPGQSISVARIGSARSLQLHMNSPTREYGCNMPANRSPIVNRDAFFSGVLVVAFVFASPSPVIQAQPGSFELKIEQITSGAKHHFFGYIGQCQTIPWNASGRYILALEIDEIDRLPKPEDAATVILIDTCNGNKIVRVDRTHAWNPQQGTMFYWHPLAAETQFFFNDRDVESGKVFTVLYDIEKMRRVREYRFHDTPIGNGGVAADGSAWLGLNYGRLARLRLVTGYPQALDWSKDEIAPEDDGIFIVNVKTGEKRLLVSCRQLDEQLRERQPNLEHDGLFVNHTLWNRDSDHIYFFARAGWNRKGARRINVPFSIRADGTGLDLHEMHIGGHPEWAEGDLLIGRQGEKQILYDVTQRR